MTAGPQSAGRRRLILAVISIAQLMVVLDATVVNIALPSAQQALHFSAAGRQWVVTAYALAFGGLLLPGGKLADLAGRKRMFLIGLIGFAAASALGGAAASFPMLVTARALQGAFGAVLAPAGLSLLTTTFPARKERGTAFGIFGAIIGSGGALGLLLGGVLTEYLSWRWCLYVNLAFAAVGVAGGVLLLGRENRSRPVRLDIVATILACGGMFSLVYGCSNAVARTWAAPTSWGFLVGGVVLLAAFARWQQRAGSPLLPPEVVRDRNRIGSFLAVFTLMAGVSGVFLFLTYYLQETLAYSPVLTGFAFLPMLACAMGTGLCSNLLLLPRTGPRRLVALGLLLVAAGMAWLAGIGPASSYAAAVLGPLIVMGSGMGLAMSPSMNSATFGVPPGETGAVSSMASASQQIGTSIGTAVLNTLAVAAVAGYLASHAGVGSRPGRALVEAALVHGYATAFWCAAAIMVAGSVACVLSFRRGPLTVPRSAQADSTVSGPGGTVLRTASAGSPAQPGPEPRLAPQ
jgi:EmrB/QacA subfamily drug resistance transporter